MCTPVAVKNANTLTKIKISVFIDINEKPTFYITVKLKLSSYETKHCECDLSEVRDGLVLGNEVLVFGHGIEDLKVTVQALV